MKEREKWIDFAKGIAILLVVIGHVNLGFIQTNMFQPQKSMMDYVNFTIYSFHMPLFFIISGYLYSKTVNIQSFLSYKHNIAKKIINLGIPYIAFSVIYGIIKLIFSNVTNKKIDVNTIIQIPIQPIEFFWYLYALISVFVLVLTLDFIIKNKYIVLGILTILFISTYIFRMPIYFLYYAFQYSLYFYIGKILQSQTDILNFKSLFFGSIVIFIMINLLGYNNFINATITKVILALTGSYLILFISNSIKELKFINYLGEISLQIYIMHELICSAIRVALLKIHITNIFTHYIVAITLGIAITILIYKVISRIKVLDFLFFPSRYLKSNKVKTYAEVNAS